jgi:excisionase family DNA binding protein
MTHSPADKRMRPAVALIGGRDGPSSLDDAPRFMSVKQVAEYLHLNEKKVYALVNEGRIPATKVTGKWLFPRTLIDQWMLESTHGGLLTDRLVLALSATPVPAPSWDCRCWRGTMLISVECTGVHRTKADVDIRR